ncbi:MAG TPA: MarC family protein [Labilithrix sp.]|nr:MarC family protein [Labilithrix sp.]
MTAVSFGLLCFSSLFTVIDPVAAAPVFVALMQGRSREEMQKNARRACAIALGVLAVFALSGALVFRIFGITLDAFRIGGGLVFLTIGLPMMAGRSDKEVPDQEATQNDPSVVPLGVPLLAGPGAITTVMVLMGQSRGPTHVAALMIALVLVLLATCAMLMIAPVVLRRLGPVGLSLVTRVMGLIVVVLGVQFIIDGARPILVDALRPTTTSTAP